MNYLESVQITKFWGSKNVNVYFHRDMNFLIGPNGSGKTTIINLIAASLKGDIPTLYSVQFEKITIKLRTVGSRNKPVIEVIKSIDEKTGSIELKYIIRGKSSDKGAVFGVEGPYDERIYRDKFARTRRFQEAGARLSSILSEVIEVNWLSVHRTSIDRITRTSRDDEFETSIDQKISEISKKFASYFSLLSSKAGEESKNFQEQVFLSLLDQELVGAAFVLQAKVEPEDKSIIIGVLKDLGVNNAKATRRVATHYSRLEGAMKKWADTNSLNIDDAVILSDARRVRQMIKKWRALNARREEIFRPKTLFEEIINNLFARKELHFDARNIPQIHFDTGETVPIDVLSSGEKQLFIILGEALLQEERPVVFISDEPELSLHVSWQNTLFANIKKLNKSSQIISATHSPDIVGPFQDKVIKIENCISNVF